MKDEINKIDVLPGIRVIPEYAMKAIPLSKKQMRDKKIHAIKERLIECLLMLFQIMGIILIFNGLFH